MIKKLFSILFLSVIFMQCGNQKSTVQKKPPFEITEKNYRVFVAGREGSANTVRLHIKGELKQLDVQFVNVFFHNREIPVQTLINDQTFTIDVRFQEPVKSDITISGNAADEYGNQAPKVDEDFPFKLNKDEAVIQYHIVGKEYYYKVTGIQELADVVME